MLGQSRSQGRMCASGCGPSRSKPFVCGWPRLTNTRDLARQAHRRGTEDTEAHVPFFPLSALCASVVKATRWNTNMEACMERVRIGMIGCGSMSRHHGRVFTRTVPEAEIVALADPDANGLARFIADVFPNQAAPTTFDDYRTML